MLPLVLLLLTGIEQPRLSTVSAEELVGQEQPHVRRLQHVLRRTRGILSVFRLLLESIWHNPHVKPVTE